MTNTAKASSGFYLPLLSAITAGSALLFIFFVQDSPQAGLLYKVASFILGLMILCWFLALYKHPVIKKGWWLFAIPVGTFLLSYLMVPMFHVMGHGLMHGTHSEVADANLVHQQVRLDVLIEPYRQVPLDIEVSPKLVVFDKMRSQVVSLTLKNTSNKELSIRVRDKLEPGVISQYLHYHLPSDHLDLDPNEQKQWLIQLSLADKTPQSVHDASLALFLFDTYNVGKLGKQKDWKKMKIKFNEQLRKQHEQ